MIDISEIDRHVEDARYFRIPGFLWDWLPESMRAQQRGLTANLPTFDLGTVELFGWQIDLQLELTKFMVLEVVVALLMLAIFLPLAWRIAGGGRPRGRLWNLFEAILLFLRDEVARPAIGAKEADRFLPFVWNIFFFILFCNLLGMVPWAGSPTAALGVTATLAAITLLTVVGSGMMKFGAAGFWTGMVPAMDLPLIVAIPLKPMLVVMEILGLLIKHTVLAVRLLANMFAGHLVLAVVASFVTATAHSLFAIWLGVTVASVLGATALSLLELFVAFLQAYIFTFLSALFIGMAVHQHSADGVRGAEKVNVTSS